MAVTVLAAYDVRADQRRAKLAALLQAWGDRVQFSVFICSVGDEQLPTLQAEIDKIINPDEDSVIIMRQCRTCWDGLIARGQGEPPRRQLYWGVF